MIQIVPGDCFPLGVILTQRMLVKFRRRKLESQSASQTCELLSDSVLTHCGLRDMEILSSNHSGKDTHGLMTVHLACYSRKQLRQDGHRLDTEEQPSPM